MIPDRFEDLTGGQLEECWRAGRDTSWDRIRSYAKNLRYLDGGQQFASLASADGLGNGADRTIWVSNNQMAANMRQILSYHVSRVPAFRIPTIATDDAAFEAARLAESLLEAKWQESGWEPWRERALWFAYASGTAGCWVDWDPIRETTIETFCSVDEMTFEPGCLDAETARWGIKQQLLPPQVVRIQYPWAFPDHAPTADAQTANYGSVALNSVRNRENWNEDSELTAVYTLYLRPSAIHPEGGFAVSINAKIVEWGAWPFPFVDRLPVALLKQLPYIENWFGRTFLEEARPIQGAIDRLTSYILMGVRDMTAPILEMPVSMRDEAQHLDGSPGQKMFRPGNHVQEGARYLSPGSWQNDPINALTMMVQALDDLMGIQDVNRGRNAPSIESGAGVALLQQASLGPVASMARRESAFWSRVGTLVVSMHSLGVLNRRRWLATESGAMRSSPWNRNELQGINRVEVPSQSLDPSEEQLIKQVAFQGMATNPEMWDVATTARVLRLSTLDEVGEEIHPDQHNARRENERFFALSDEVIAAEESEEPMFINAVLAQVHPPNALDDHAIHIATHANDFKSERFRLLPQLLQDVMMMHYKTHEKEHAMMMKQREEMRIAMMQRQMQALGGGQEQLQLAG